MDVKRINVVVRGRVQGVGFRYFVLRVAGKLGVTGWVRNAGNGNVEAVAQGPAQTLERFVQQLREGPPGAYVQNVSVQWEEPEESLTGFELRPTSYS